RVLIRQNGASFAATFMLVDLASGRAQLLNDDAAHLALSPDGSTAAEYTDDAVVLVDLGSGARRVLRRLANPLVAPVFGTGASGTQTVIGSMGRSPAGSLLAVRDGPDTLVLDQHGRLRARLRGAGMVNGSQSWSPDGRA